MFEVIQKGLFKDVTDPVFGKQHQGITPGGAMDSYSYQVGRRLLKNYPKIRTLEIIIPPVLTFSADCWCILTGAKYKSVRLKRAGDTLKDVPFAAVFQVKKGDTISFIEKNTGFRSYLSMLPINADPVDLAGRVRPDYSEMYDWVDKQGLIRVMEGPEYHYLKNRDVFTQNYWIITNDFSDMGFRLSTHAPLPEVTIKNMVSEAVSDGTVQLTPKGPIVLLKYRQTVGGYPRIYNAISADVDLLGQYAPNHILRFTKVSPKQAVEVARRKKFALEKINL